MGSSTIYTMCPYDRHSQISEQNDNQTSIQYSRFLERLCIQASFAEATLLNSRFLCPETHFLSVSFHILGRKCFSCHLSVICDLPLWMCGCVPALQAQALHMVSPVTSWVRSRIPLSLIVCPQEFEAIGTYYDDSGKDKSRKFHYRIMVRPLVLLKNPNINDREVTEGVQHTGSKKMEEVS